MSKCEACGKGCRPGKKTCSYACRDDMKRRRILASRFTRPQLVDLDGETVGLLPLDHLQFTIVDRDVFEEVGHLVWSTNKGGYAFRRPTAGKDLFLHRYVNKTPEGFFTDHINGDKLDNRRANLRTVTSIENANAFQADRPGSIARGVTFNRKTGKWRAQVRRFGVVVYGGEYDDPNEAMAVAARLMKAENVPTAE